MDIVTAFVDIGRGNWTHNPHGKKCPEYIPRSVDTYIERFTRMCELENPIFCYLDPEFLDKNQDRLPKKDNVTYRDGSVIYDQFREEYLEKIQKVFDSSYWNYHFKNDPMPERWNAEYILINFLKSAFTTDHSMVLSQTLAYTQARPPKEIAWLDFGYFRTGPKVKRVEEKLNGDKMVFFTNGPKINGDVVMSHTPVELIHTGDVLLQGCHIFGTSYAHSIWQYDMIEAM